MGESARPCRAGARGAGSRSPSTAAIDRVFATWDDVRFDTERVIDNGDEVVALGVLRGHLHAAGMEIDSPHGQI